MESAVEEPVQDILSEVSEGRVAEVVAAGGGLDEVFGPVERARDGAGDLLDFDGVGEAGCVVVALGCQEDLGFVF